MAELFALTLRVNPRVLSTLVGFDWCDFEGLAFSWI